MTASRVFQLEGKRVFVAGHRGLLGSAIVRELKRRGVTDVITAAKSEVDLRDWQAVSRFFEKTRPEVVIGCAAVVGGIQANTAFPVEFINDNTLISLNLARAAHNGDVAKLVFIGSNCMYPRDAAQPMTEDLVMTGAAEKTNLAYAMAKLSGCVQVQSYAQEYGRKWITVIPASMYGPNDNYDPKFSHVAPALLVRFIKAKKTGADEVMMWGTGSPRREFLYVDDGARGVLQALEHYESPQPLNIGYGSDISVREAAETVARVVGYKGRLSFDTSKPDGSPRKLLDSSRAIGLGYKPEIDFERGMRMTYDWISSSKDFRGHQELG